MNDPRHEYDRRLTGRRTWLQELRRRDTIYANGRFVVFAAGAAVAWAVFGGPDWPLAALAVPLGVFISLLVLHEWAIRRTRDAEQSVRYYENGLRRLDHQWAGHGVPGDEYRPRDHVYAEDLDVFGRGSLFELVNAARTRSGEETLARWLCGAAGREEIILRQQAVRELTPQADFRERLWILGGAARPELRPSLMIDWLAPPRRLPGRTARWIAAVITAAVAGTALAWAFDAVSARVLVYPIVPALIYQAWIRKRAAEVLRSGDEPLKDLRVIARVARCIEGAAVHAPRLAALQDALRSDNSTASGSIHALARLNSWQEAQRNAMFAPFALVLLWNVHFAFAIESWRLRHGKHVRRWLDAIGEFEALSSLATYAFEQPDDVYPEIVEGPALFDGEGLGHPLLPRTNCVRNSVSLGESTRLIVVSGSNMSGKSTLLRTIGANAVLALCGAPVRATRLRIAQMQIGASLHIVDSIQSGISHFYAEILRLRDLLGQARSPVPVLFLIDEILHGTNSHDRRIGAEAVLRGLVDAGAVGLVTTHDLALTAIADALGDHARNVHFVDEWVEDRLVFDYKMRPGVVERSNALALMRKIGLDV